MYNDKIQLCVMTSLWCHQYDGATLTFSFNKRSVSFILPTYPAPLYLSPSYKTGKYSTLIPHGWPFSPYYTMYFITLLTELEQCLQRSFAPIQRVTSFHFFCSSSLCHIQYIYILSHTVIHTSCTYMYISVGFQCFVLEIEILSISCKQ